MNITTMQTVKKNRESCQRRENQHRGKGLMNITKNKITIEEFHKKFNELQIQLRNNEKNIQKKLRQFKQELLRKQGVQKKKQINKEKNRMRKTYEDSIKNQLELVRQVKQLLSFQMQYYSSYYDTFNKNKDSIKQTQQDIRANILKLNEQVIKIQKQQHQKQTWLNDACLILNLCQNQANTEEDIQTKDLVNKLIQQLSNNVKCLMQVIKRLQKQRLYLKQLQKNQQQTYENVRMKKLELLQKYKNIEVPLKQISIDVFKSHFNMLQLSLRQTEAEIKNNKENITKFKNQLQKTQDEKIKKSFKNKINHHMVLYQDYITNQLELVRQVKQLLSFQMQDYSSYYDTFNKNKDSIKQTQQDIRANILKLNEQVIKIQKQQHQKQTWLNDACLILNLCQNQANTEEDIQTKDLVNKLIQQLSNNVKCLMQVIKRLQKQRLYLKQLQKNQQQTYENVRMKKLELLQKYKNIEVPLKQISIDVFKSHFNMLQLSLRQTEAEIKNNKENITKFQNQLQKTQDEKIKNSFKNKINHHMVLYQDYITNQLELVRQVKQLLSFQMQDYSSYYDTFNKNKDSIKQTQQDIRANILKLNEQVIKIQKQQHQKQTWLNDACLILNLCQNQANTEEDIQTKDLVNKLIQQLRNNVKCLMQVIKRLQKQRLYLKQLQKNQQQTYENVRMKKLELLQKYKNIEVPLKQISIDVFKSHFNMLQLSLRQTEAEIKNNKENITKFKNQLQKTQDEKIKKSFKNKINHHMVLYQDYITNQLELVRQVKQLLSFQMQDYSSYYDTFNKNKDSIKQTQQDIRANILKLNEQVIKIQKQQHQKQTWLNDTCLILNLCQNQANTEEDIQTKDLVNKLIQQLSNNVKCLMQVIKRLQKQRLYLKQLQKNQQQTYENVRMKKLELLQKYKNIEVPLKQISIDVFKSHFNMLQLSLRQTEAEIKNNKENITKFQNQLQKTQDEKIKNSFKNKINHHMVLYQDYITNQLELVRQVKQLLSFQMQDYSSYYDTFNKNKDSIKQTQQDIRANILKLNEQVIKIQKQQHQKQTWLNDACLILNLCQNQANTEEDIQTKDLVNKLIQQLRNNVKCLMQVIKRLQEQRLYLKQLYNKFHNRTVLPPKVFLYSQIQNPFASSLVIQKVSSQSSSPISLNRLYKKMQFY